MEQPGPALFAVTQAWHTLSLAQSSNSVQQLTPRHSLQGGLDAPRPESQIVAVHCEAQLELEHVRAAV